MTDALLVLEDGSFFLGKAFGARGEAFGEAVFNTAMAGYQEVLTDPSYTEQIVVMTSPHQGNYGVNGEDVESDRVRVAGFAVREASRRASSWRASGTLQIALEAAGVIGIQEIDTRRLTLRIRESGAMRAAVSTEDPDVESLLEKVRAHPGMEGADLAAAASVEEPYEARDLVGPAGTDDGRVFRVAVYDFGLKRNILRLLAENGCEAVVFPAHTPAAEVLEYGFKLRFGHRGVNQPVKDRESGRIEITSHNHGFAVDPAGWETSARTGDVEGETPIVETSFGSVALTHWNLNDGTLEGLRCLNIPAFSVQYHPEASPGPHDSRHLFVRFRELMA